MTCSSEFRLGGAFLLVLALAVRLTAEPATFTTHIAPILENHCTVCHGEKKQKASLRLDSFSHLVEGGEDGDVVEAGEPQHSELFRRITLPAGHEDVMPSDDKPLLSSEEIALIEKWIVAGASDTATFDAPGRLPVAIALPAAPDYRPRLATALELAHTLGVKLVPRSDVPTDGLVLRTASAPTRCTDAVLIKLAPVADLIVEAELARTNVTDAGLTALAACANLQTIDLSQTAITSRGLPALVSLSRLTTVNLTQTAVDAAGVTALRSQLTLENLWYFDTPAQPDE